MSTNRTIGGHDCCHAFELRASSDAVEIARLTTQLGYELTEPQATDRLSRILLRSDQQFFVADLDGRSVGWVHVVLAEYVDAEAVCRDRWAGRRSSSHRRIGRALMGRAEVWAKERGCSMVRLSSSATRDAAHRFYESLGCTNIKTQYALCQTAGPGRGRALCRALRSARGPAS